MKDLRAAIEAHAELMAVVQETLSHEVEAAAQAAITALRHGGQLLFFGNGGSASISEHLATEFVGNFQRQRAPLPAVSLATAGGLMTSLANDYGFDKVFSRQIQALGRPQRRLVRPEHFRLEPQRAGGGSSGQTHRLRDGGSQRHGWG